MKQSLKKILNRLYSSFVTLNNPYYFYGIPNADYATNKQLITLNKIVITIDKVEGESLLKGYPHALKIHEALGGKFSVFDQKLFLEINDLKFQINSSEELFIIYEVFVSEVYKYCCLKDSLFIDIGMNSAVTTLFYALNPKVKKIYSYELFKPTFLLGQQNLNLNEKYSHKVKAFNYGLSNKEFKTTVNYSLSRKGRMGLKGLPSDEHFNDVRKEDVAVKEINEIFTEIMSASEGLDIIVKMDCEGEEFNLIESLSKSGLLKKLTALIIEWHYIRPVEIENHLKQSDFHVFSQVLPDLNSGMIYAGKR